MWEATDKAFPLMFCTAIGDRKLLQPVTKGQFKAIVAVLWPGAIPSKLKRTLLYVWMFSAFKIDTLLWYMLIHFFILPLTSLLCHLIYNVVGIVVSFHLISKDQWSPHLITKPLQKGHFFPLQYWPCLRGREATGWKTAFPTVMINHVGIGFCKYCSHRNTYLG